MAKKIQKFIGTPDEFEVVKESKFIGTPEEIEVEEEINLPQCIICEHLIDAEKQTCEAFPKGIPDDLFIGDVAHTTSMRGDNGILFDPIEEVLVEQE